MVPLHVVSGMNGAIMVLPRDGLKDEKGNGVRYDRAYYIGEQDFYIPREESGRYKSYATPAAGFGDMLNVMKTLTLNRAGRQRACGSPEGAPACAR